MLHLHRVAKEPSAAVPAALHLPQTAKMLAALGAGEGGQLEH